MRLAQKNILITGAGGGIGRAAVRRFIEEGARVVLADLNTDELQPLVDEFGSDRAACVAVDVTDQGQVEHMVRFCVDTFGGVDVFVANAGIEGKIGEIIDSDVSDLDRVLAVNVRGVWLGLHHVIPVMRERGGGSIIITSSGAGVKGMPNMVPYNTSKHAVVGMMRCAALECAKYNIRVNTVNPGAIETRMMRSIEEGFVPGAGGAFKQQIKESTPMGRYGEPEEVANMMVFLASDESSYCTGSVYMVDGGNAT